MGRKFGGFAPFWGTGERGPYLTQSCVVDGSVIYIDRSPMLAYLSLSCMVDDFRVVPCRLWWLEFY